VHSDYNVMQSINYYIATAIGCSDSSIVYNNWIYYSSVMRQKSSVFDCTYSVLGFLIIIEFFRHGFYYTSVARSMGLEDIHC
jgi:hypothetical protein